MPRFRCSTWDYLIGKEINLIEDWPEGVIVIFTSGDLTESLSGRRGREYGIRWLLWRKVRSQVELGTRRSFAIHRVSSQGTRWENIRNARQFEEIFNRSCAREKTFSTWFSPSVKLSVNTSYKQLFSILIINTQSSKLKDKSDIEELRSRLARGWGSIWVVENISRAIRAAPISTLMTETTREIQPWRPAKCRLIIGIGRCPVNDFPWRGISRKFNRVLSIQTAWGRITEISLRSSDRQWPLPLHFDGPLAKLITLKLFSIGSIQLPIIYSVPIGKFSNSREQKPLLSFPGNSHRFSHRLRWELQYISFQCLVNFCQIPSNNTKSAITPRMPVSWGPLRFF